MRRLLLALLVAAAALAGAQHASAAPACSITFLPASGAWSVGTNWDLGRIPAPGEHVCIPAGRTATHASLTTTVATVQVGGALHVDSGTLRLTDTAEDSTVATLRLDGTIGGAGRLVVTGAMTWRGGTMQDAGVTRIAAGATLHHTSWTTLATGRVLEIAGTLAFATPDRYIEKSGSPAPLIHNTGLIQTTVAGAGLRAAVRNDGRIEAPAGYVSLTGGGSGDGDFGTGSVRLEGGTFVLGDGARLLDGAAIDGSAAVDVAAGATVAVAGAVAMAGGTVGGTGTLSVPGALTWSDGTMEDAGVTRIEPGGTITHAGWTTLATGRVLENAGTLALAMGNRYIEKSGIPAPLIQNLPTGVIRRTVAGTDLIELRAALDNDGAVVSDAGPLELGDGAGVSGGVFGADGSAGTVRLHGGTFALGDGAALRDGAVIVAGTVSVPAGATVTADGTTAISGGEVSGPGTFVVDGTLTWSDGTMRGAGVTRVLPGATLRHTSWTTLADGRVLENAGTFELATDNRYVERSGTPAPLIHNLPTGVVRRTAPGANAVQLRAAIDNDGLVTATEGRLELTGGGSSTGDFGGGAGTVRLLTGAHTLEDGARLLGGTVLAGPASVPAGATATVAGAASLTGGELGGAGTLAVADTLTWSGGDMTGAGTTRVLAGGRLVQTGSRMLEAGRRLENAGTLDVEGSVFTGLGAAPLLHNTGTLRKLAGSTTSFLDVPLRNDGVVDGQFGLLRLSNGADTAHTGTFRGASAAAHPVLGDGFGDAHTLAGAVTLDGWVGIDGDVTVVDGDTLTVPVGVTLAQEGGELRGALAVPGELRWSGGSHAGPGTTTVPAGGLVVIDGADGCSASLSDGRRLANAGTLLISNGADLTAFDDTDTVLDNTGRIEIDSSGTSCGGRGGISSGDLALRNSGTIDKVAGAAEAQVDARLDNEGTVRASAGVLELGGATADEPQGGAFTSAPGARLVLGFGDFVLAPGASMTGDLGIDGGRLEIPEGMSLAVPTGGTLTLEGGTLAGGGDLRVAGTLEWRGGDQEGPGMTVIEPAGVAAVGGDGAFADLRESRALVNEGATSITDGELFVGDGASLVNDGTLVLGTDGQLSGSGFGFGSGSLLHNTGTLRKEGPTVAQAELPVENEGAIEVAGGRLELPRLLNWSSLFLASGSLTGGEYVVRGGSALVLPGALEAVAARVTLDGAGSQLLRRDFSSPTPVDALAGLRRITAAGDLGLTGGRSHTLSGALHNAGSLRLGPGSTLGATTYRQTGVLRTTVSGNALGRLAATGAAALGGRLDITTAAPGTGTTPLSVVTAGTRTGAFGSVTGAAGRWSVGYTGTAVTLTRIGTGVLRTAVAPALAPPAAEEPPLVVAARDLRVARGSWTRRGRYVVARRRGATLVRRDVAGRGLAIRARTCRRCGAVTVRWGGKAVRVSLRARRPGRRVVAVPGLDGRRGTVRLRASSRRVAIAALLVLR